MRENCRILVIQGHPDVTENHLGHDLAHAYATAAIAAGHQVRTATPAQLEFPLLRSQKEWEQGPLPPGLQKALAAVPPGRSALLRVHRPGSDARTQFLVLEREKP